MINNYRYIIEIFFINILNHILSITSQVNYILHMIYLTSSFITRMIFRQKKIKNVFIIEIQTIMENKEE